MDCNGIREHIWSNTASAIFREMNNEMVAYLDADQRDLIGIDLPELASLNTQFMHTNSTLRGLANRWNTHRSGRFGWHRSWVNKDRFTDIADLAWPKARAQLVWNEATYHLPRFAAYRLVGVHLLSILRAMRVTKVTIKCIFNPIISILVASRIPSVRVELQIYSQIGRAEAIRFTKLEKLPSYLLDFIPWSIAKLDAHRRINVIEPAVNQNEQPKRQYLSIYVHDLCDIPLTPVIMKDIYATRGCLLFAPVNLFPNANIITPLFLLNGINFALMIII